MIPSLPPSLVLPFPTPFIPPFWSIFLFSEVMSVCPACSEGLCLCSSPASACLLLCAQPGLSTEWSDQQTGLAVGVEARSPGEADAAGASVADTASLEAREAGRVWPRPRRRFCYGSGDEG